MKLKNYCLYRKMSGEEARSVLKDAKLTIIKNSRLCPFKCFSESLIVPYRLNPYITDPSRQILKFSLSNQTRDFLLSNCIKTKSIYPDKSYRQYEKFNGQSIYYNCHGKEIDLFNFEFNSDILDYLNKNITNIESLNLSEYGSIVLDEYFDFPLKSFISHKDLFHREFYIQLPFDLAIIALKFQKIPQGGINKSIKARYISKNFDLLEKLNLYSLPVTLAVSLRYSPVETKLKSVSLDESTFAVNSNLISYLNNLIESIRLVEYFPDRGKHKFSNKNPINLFELLKNKLPTHQTVEQKKTDLSQDDILNLIDSASLNELFVKNLLNIDSSIFKGDCMHGLYHAHKTCLFSFILSNLLKFTNDEIEILIYAALFHDIGRTDSLEDNTHGIFGAEKINDFAIYINNPEKRNMLMFLIDCHDLNLNDELLIEKLLKYKITNTLSALRMLSVLKDSDALDRTRFTIYSNNASALNPDFLIYHMSHRLIAFSGDLNYAFEITSTSNQKKLSNLKSK